MPTYERKRSLAELAQIKRLDDKIEKDKEKVCRTLRILKSICIVSAIISGLFFEPKTRLIANSLPITLFVLSFYFFIVFFCTSQVMLSDWTAPMEYKRGKMAENEIHEKWEKPTYRKYMASMIDFPINYFIAVAIIKTLITIIKTYLI